MIALPNNKKKPHHYSFALQHCGYTKCIQFYPQAIPDDTTLLSLKKNNGICVTVFRVGACQHYNFNFYHFYFLDNV